MQDVFIGSVWGSVVNAHYVAVECWGLTIYIDTADISRSNTAKNNLDSLIIGFSQHRIKHSKSNIKIVISMKLGWIVIWLHFEYRGYSVSIHSMRLRHPSIGLSTILK